MKFKFATLILVHSCFLFAGSLQIEPSDSISLIPSGSKIKFEKDFNIKPTFYVHKIGETKNTALDKVSCFLELVDSSDKDRVIKRGTEIEIKFFGMNYPRFITPNNSKISCIYCKRAYLNSELTIGQFVDAISENAKLIMSDPIEF